MSNWILDDQPQMVQAAHKAYYEHGIHADRMLEAAFAAIDREALIEKMALRMDGLSINPNSRLPSQTEFKKWRRRMAEQLLIAAGIIPERS